MLMETSCPTEPAAYWSQGRLEVDALFLLFVVILVQVESKELI
ncbi:hypothetical protein LINGRAHAP2_LOCUS28674, partial [Linum grandiflorum]